ncbi:MAG: hypothetical protein B6229_08595 [Spirochaetaceae bacterium 4572_7]|nr:MAG: hypothetical protein B6229_08595 [Spirochaetaceae bacterium 4572_7]
MKIIYNNKLINKESLIISPLSQGFSYGVGFFTTIKVTNRKPENLDLHLERIIKSLNYFSFAITVPPLESLIIILKLHFLRIYQKYRILFPVNHCLF